MKSKAVIQFLKGWREFQHGMIHLSGRVKVEYDPGARRIVSRYGVGRVLGKGIGNNPVQTVWRRKAGG